MAKIENSPPWSGKNFFGPSSSPIERPPWFGRPLVSTILGHRLASRGLRGRWSHVQGLKGSLPSPIIIIIIIIIIRCDWCVYHPFGNFTCYVYYSRLPLNTSSILLRLQAAGKKLCLLDMIYVFWTLKKTMKNVFSSFFQEQHILFYWFLTIFQFKFTSNN